MKILIDVDVVGKVRELVAKNESFSAYNVTEKLREEGFYADKDFVGAIVHSEMAQIGNYGRDWVNYPGYYNYRPNGDVSVQLNGQNLVQQTQKAIQKVVSQATQKAIASVQPKTVRVGTENRVNVPIDLVSKLHLTPGSTVYVSDSVKGEWKLSPFVTSPLDRKLTVGKKGSVRLRLGESNLPYFSRKVSITYDNINNCVKVKE